MNRSLKRDSIKKLYKSSCTEFEEKDCLIQNDCIYNYKKTRCLPKINKKLNLENINNNQIHITLNKYITIGNLDMLKFLYENNNNVQQTLQQQSIRWLNLAIITNNCNIVTWLIHNIHMNTVLMREYVYYHNMETIISDNNLEMLKCLLDNDNNYGIIKFIDYLNYAIISTNFRITKFLLDYTKYKFTKNDNTKISESLDNTSTMLLYPHQIVIFEDEYDEYVDIIWYLLEYGFIYQGNEPDILHIIQKYNYTILQENLKDKISEIGILKEISKY
jgi:hypothetical protein